METYTPDDAYYIFKTMCNSCEHMEETELCQKGHRTKKIGISTGPIAEIIVRKKGGCPDWVRWINEGAMGEAAMAGNGIIRRFFGAL